MTRESTFSLSKGFMPHQKEEAVRLFWEAFKGKLNPVMRPEEKALHFLREAVDPAHAISASTPDGILLGIAGFKTKTGAFIGGNLRQICRTYGILGGIWRAVILSLLERPVQSETLLMDGIFVSSIARGQGVGTALLSAIKAEAIAQSCRQVRLDVIDTNPRAKVLYQREGFTPTATTDIGSLRHIFNFQKSTTMTCKLL